MVVANPGGSGQIVYGDGCTVQVRPGSIVAVAPQSPCIKEEAPVEVPASTNNNALVVGGVVIGSALAGLGIAALIIHQKDKPASP
jgi:hypothetical protein